jgi:hypothetical protein
MSFGAGEAPSGSGIVEPPPLMKARRLDIGGVGWTRFFTLDWMFTKPASRLARRRVELVGLAFCQPDRTGFCFARA